MNAELVAGNIAAHWIQAGILSAAAALAIRLLNLNEPRSQGSTDVTVAVFGEDGQTHRGDVVLQLEGPAVQSPTTPSFAMRLLNIR